MKGEREIQLDNQPSPTRVLRGSRRRAQKTVTELPKTASTITTQESFNDNNNITISTSANIESSIDSGYSSQSQSPSSSGEQYLMDFNIQSPDVSMSSPVRRRRSSVGSIQTQRSKHGKSHRHQVLSKRKSLPAMPVIHEQDDVSAVAMLSAASPRPSPPTHRKPQNTRLIRTNLQRRPTSVSDAVIGACHSFPGARRKGSTILLDRRELKKRISTLADSIVSGGATIVPVVPATANASRRGSEVYSVIPRKSHLPRYGFIIQRNPYTPPPSYRRRLSAITLSGCPHQVRRKQSTISIDEINKQLTRAKLEKRDSKVQFSVVEEAGLSPHDARRGSLAGRSDASASQVAESVYSPSPSESESASSSGSDSSSSEWTTDSADSEGSESDSDSDTDSSYSTTTTSSSSSSSSSDSSSDDSSSDSSSADSDSSDYEDASSMTSRSTSRSTFYNESPDTGSVIANSSSLVATSVVGGVTEQSNEYEKAGKTRTSRRSSVKGSDKLRGSSDRSFSSASGSSSSATEPTSAESRRTSVLSRSSSKSSFRSSSSSPIKSKKDKSLSRRSSRSSSLERPPSRSMSVLSNVMNSQRPSVNRRDSKRSKKSRTSENEETHQSDKSVRKKEKLERRKSNSHVAKENGDLPVPAGDNVSTVSTPSIIVHKATEDRIEMPPNNVSTMCVIL